MTRNFPRGKSDAPAAAKNMLVGVGMGMAVEAMRVPVPHLLKSFRNFDSLLFLNLLSRYADPALRATRNVRKAPMTDPAVAMAAYSYQGSRCVADKTAVRMSGPLNVGMGELSRMAMKKRPSAPRWRRVEAKVRGTGRFFIGARRFSMFEICPCSQYIKERDV